MKQETLKQASELNEKIAALGSAIKHLQAKYERPEQRVDPHDDYTEDQWRRLRSVEQRQVLERIELLTTFRSELLQQLEAL